MTDFNQSDVEPVKTPTEIGRIRLIIDDWGSRPPVTSEGPGAQYQGSYEVQILDQNGVLIRSKSGDLLPYLTTTQKNAIKNLQDAFRVKAQKLLPAP